MGYQAYITNIKNVHKHSNADRLQVGECFGNQVIISLETKENELGVYFPTDGKLGESYADVNNLVRKKDENGNEIGGYLEPEKRHIRALRLRGEMSDGLFMPLDSLSTFTDIAKLKSGDKIDVLNGVLICEKYIPRVNISSQKQDGQGKQGSQKKKKFKAIRYPLFSEHIDTKQLVYNLGQFKKGDLCTISLKVHGTSARTSYSLETKYTEPTLWNKILMDLKLKKEVMEKYKTISGTRRVVLNNYEGGYHGGNKFREKYHEYFSDKLKKNETIYYEILGYDDNERPLMGRAKNKKVGKEFAKRFGEETIFSYGCDIGENDIYAYRMTMTNEDGDIIEYPTYLLKIRCEQMNVKVVPVYEQFYFTTKRTLMNRVEKYYEGVDPIGLTHIKEGIVVKIENKEKFTAFKHKNTDFKILEGIIKSEDFIDVEEQEELKGE